jgi:hypothetical protein
VPVGLQGIRVVPLRLVVAGAVAKFDEDLLAGLQHVIDRRNAAVAGQGFDQPPVVFALDVALCLDQFSQRRLAIADDGARGGQLDSDTLPAPAPRLCDVARDLFTLNASQRAANGQWQSLPMAK